MNENKFHKKIESSLSPEEKIQKQKTWEKIVEKTGYQNSRKKKSEHIIKWIPIATAFAMVCIIIPILVLVMNGNNFTSTEGRVSNSDSSLGTEWSKSEASYVEENHPIKAPKDCYSGKIVVDGDVKYFDSDDGIYHLVITSEVLIESYNTSSALVIGKLKNGADAFALIVTEENASNYLDYKVGDMIKVIVR